MWLKISLLLSLIHCVAGEKLHPFFILHVLASRIVFPLKLVVSFTCREKCIPTQLPRECWHHTGFSSFQGDSFFSPQYYSLLYIIYICIKFASSVSCFKFHLEQEHRCFFPYFVISLFSTTAFYSVPLKRCPRNYL